MFNAGLFAASAEADFELDHFFMASSATILENRSNPVAFPSSDTAGAL